MYSNCSSDPYSLMCTGTLKYTGGRSVCITSGGTLGCRGTPVNTTTLDNTTTLSPVLLGAKSYKVRRAIFFISYLLTVSIKLHINKCNIKYK